MIAVVMNVNSFLEPTCAYDVTCRLEKCPLLNVKARTPHWVLEEYPAIHSATPTLELITGFQTSECKNSLSKKF